MAVESGNLPHLSTLFGLSGALGMPAHELLHRVRHRAEAVCIQIPLPHRDVVHS